MKYAIAFVLICAAGLLSLPAHAASMSMEDFVDADFYPSAASAARRLAVRWIESLGDQRPKVITIDAADVPSSAQEAVISVLKVRFRDARVEIGKDESSLAARMTWTSAQKDQHLLTLGAFSLKVIEKPWVEDPKATPAGGKDDFWAVVHSRGPFSNQADAAASARAAANAALAEALRQKFLQMHHGRVDADTLALLLDHHLIDHSRSFLADRFIQKFDRPYGPVWEESQLIHATSPQLDVLATSILRSVQHQQETRRHSIFAAGAILIVSLLVYQLANVLTRGYFVWKLRMTITVAALLSAIAAVLCIAA